MSGYLSRHSDYEYLQALAWQTNDDASCWNPLFSTLIFIYYFRAWANVSHV